MTSKTCFYCKKDQPADGFVSSRRCGTCAATRLCRICGEAKPIMDFPQTTSWGCRACRESGRSKAKKAEREAARYQTDRDRMASRNAAWKDANAPRYRPQQREYRNAQRLKIRNEVLDRMGGRCVCCGEAEPLFLTIDHIDGNGALHRRQIGKTDMWKWLHANDYPTGFQLLCFNCNAGKHRNGGRCPHEEVANPDSRL